MASASVVTNVLAATELAFARNAAWTIAETPDAYSYAPDTGADPEAENPNTGVSVQSAVSAFVVASVPYKPNQITAFVKIARSVYDSAEDYSITLNGTDTYTSTGETTAMLCVADLVAQINAAASADADPRAVAVGSTTDGVLDTVLVYAVGDPATETAPVLTIDVATTHGDGEAVAMPTYCDASSFSIRLWGKFATPSTGLPTGMTLPWVVLNNGDIGAIDADFGWCERISVAALERLYVEVYDVVDRSGNGASVLSRANIAYGVAIPE